MADDTIKDFLVGIGFSVDKVGQKKFTDGIDSATKYALGLGAAATAAAAAVSAGVLKMAADFDDLYWQTQRLGSSATDIRGVGYAMSQLGGSAGGAKAAMEGIAEFARSYPGSEGFLKKLGVTPQDFGDSAKMFKDVEQAFQQMPYYRAKAYAGTMGIDPLTLQAMMRDTGEFEQEFQAMADKVGKAWGVNLDQMADDSNAFSTHLRQMKAEWGLTLDVLEFKVLQKIIPAMDWISSHGEVMDDVLSGCAVVMGAFAVAALAASWEILAVAGAITAVIVAYNRLTSIKGPNAGPNVTGDINPVVAGAGRGSHKTNPLNWVIDTTGHAGNSGHWEGIGSGAKNASGQAGASGFRVGGDYYMPAPAGSAAPVVPGNQGGDKFTHAVALARAAGLSEGGARGFVAGMYADSGHLNPDDVNRKSGAQGIAQWLTKSRIRDIQQHFHKSLKSMSRDEQEQAAIWELGAKFPGLNRILRSGTMDQATALRNTVRIFEAPGDTSGDNHRGNALLGTHPVGGGVVISQKTDIHLAPGNKDVASAVAAKQGHVNQKLVADASVFAW